MPTTTHVIQHSYSRAVVIEIPDAVVIGAGLTVVAIAGVLLVLWLRRRHRP